MNEFDNLIIEAFRDKNFKFAAEALDLDPEASALAILNGRLDAALKARNYDEKLVNKIYNIYLKALSFLMTKLGSYDVDAPFSYNKDTDVFILSNTGNPQADKFYQALMVNILDRLGESATVTSPTTTSPTTTSPTTFETTSEEENPFAVTPSNETATSYENTNLVINIRTKDGSSSNSTLINNTEVGSKTVGGLDVEDIDVAPSHLYFFRDGKNNFKWSVLGAQLKNTYFNQRSMEAKIYPLKPGDTMYFGSTFVTIKEIVNSSNPISITGGGASSAGSASSEITSESVEPNPFAVDGPAVEISSNPSSSASPSNSKPKITLEVSGEEYQPTKVIKFDKDIDIGRDPANDIILNDGRISRSQASIFLDNEQWFIKDNDSANGTFINGNNTRIQEPVQLKKDDRIRFGPYYIKVKSIDSEETNEFGNSNTSNGGFFGSGSGGRGGGFGGFGGRRRSL
jgi:hypothetical protein